jgi:hypothetical protein
MAAPSRFHAAPTQTNVNVQTQLRRAAEVQQAGGVARAANVDDTWQLMHESQYTNGDKFNLLGTTC